MSSTQASDESPDLESQALKDAQDIAIIEHALTHDEFEYWNDAIKDIKEHFGFTEDDLQNR